MKIEHIEEAVSFLVSRGVSTCGNAIILGTGLSKIADVVTDKITISYKDIPHFPVSTVESHSGNLIVGYIQSIKVIVLQGRFHFYEGYAMSQVVFPIYVLQLLGVKNLFISNAAGAINLSFKKGELMLITDHINLFANHPLIGPNHSSLGTRFPDMSNAYDNKLNDLLIDSASNLGIKLNRGVYISAQGPMLETPAEYKMLKILGGDAVGMSTIPEVIAANHAGIRCCAISVLTDECDPDHLEPIAIDDIIATALKAEKKLVKLVLAFFENLS